MRVCIVASLLLEGRTVEEEPFEEPLEGTARIAHELATRLVDSDIEVVVVTDSPTSHVTKTNRNYRALTVGSRFSFRNVIRFRKLLRKIRPDIIHFHGGELMAYYARFAGLFGHARTVLTSTFLPSVYRRSLPRRVGLCTSLFSKWPFGGSLHLSKFDHIIALTDFARASLISKSKVDPTRISTIRYGISSRYLESNGTPTSRFAQEVLFISGNNKLRGAHVFQQSIPLVRSLMPSVDFMVAARNMRDEDSWRTTPHVKVLQSRDFSGLSSDAIVTLPLADHVTVDPPLSLLESMAMGRTIVSTPIGSIPEIIGRDRGILVPKNDPSALASALRGLLTNSTLRRDLGQNAKEYTRRAYNWNCAMDSIQKIYQG